jgi:hypothetical protein
VPPAANAVMNILAVSGATGRGFGEVEEMPITCEQKTSWAEMAKLMRAMSKKVEYLADDAERMDPAGRPAAEAREWIGPIEDLLDAAESFHASIARWRHAMRPLVKSE